MNQYKIFIILKGSKDERPLEYMTIDNKYRAIAAAKILEANKAVFAVQVIEYELVRKGMIFPFVEYKE